MGQKEKEEKGTDEAVTGNFIFPNNDRYKGEYQIGAHGPIERHGNGTFESATGIIYTGQWKNDKMNGQGHIQYPSGSTYEGEFLDNQYHGQGAYTWPNGCNYKGTFVNSKLIGEGTFCDLNNQTWIGDFHYTAAPALKFLLNL